jgi:iron complex outermembrane receptor protein
VVYKYLTLFISITSAFCNNSSIQGFSTDSESKEPLIGANIMLDGTSLDTASDENGYYIIKNIPIGTYTLRAMFIGYETLEKEIWVEGSHKYTIDIKLRPSAIELQETRVTAEKRKEKITEAPASIEIISSREIKRETTTNMGSYLKGLKGIDFTSSGINNYSISIRGFNSSFNTRVLTLTDGRVANMPALRVINYSAVPQSMDDVDRIEVAVAGPKTTSIRSTSSIDWGTAL